MQLEGLCHIYENRILLYMRTHFWVEVKTKKMVLLHYCVNSTISIDIRYIQNIANKNLN